MLATVIFYLQTVVLVFGDAKKHLESLLNEKTALEEKLHNIESQIRSNKLFKHLSNEIDKEDKQIEQNKDKNTPPNNKVNNNNNKSRLQQMDSKNIKNDEKNNNNNNKNPIPNDTDDSSSQTSKKSGSNLISPDEDKNNALEQENYSQDSGLPSIFADVNSHVSKDATSIRQEIIDEFMHCWNSYKKCAWGHDTLHPISCRGSDSNFNMGLTMIDSLDTMILMAQNDGNYGDSLSSTVLNEINVAKDWISEHLTYDHNDISLFESTIRLLGGLLSSYHLTREKIFLTKAKELGDALLIAYNTETGIPYATIDMKHSRAYHPSWARNSMSTSEGGTVQLEMNYLSFLTGNNIYSDKAMKAQQVIINAMKRSKPALLRKFISTKTGQFTDTTMSIGGRIDSTYEYFLKVFLQLASHEKYDYVWEAYL